MYLSYSGHKTYSLCPKQYWHSYIDKTVPVKPENKVNSMYGSMVGTLFEIFYADKLWMRKGVEELLLSMVDETWDRLVKNETRGGIIEFKDKDERANYKSKNDLLDDVRESIPRGLAIIRYHRLLGTDAEAEVKLDSWVEGHRLGGRADFIMTRIKPHGDRVILDGKGSKHRDTYVDPWQLKWYAMLYREKYIVPPDGLGFVYWRSEPEKSMDWIPVLREDLDILKQGVVTNASHIDAVKLLLDTVPKAEHPQVILEGFPAKPSRDCKLCSFLETCREGQAYENAKVPAAFYGTDGVEDVGI